MSTLPHNQSLYSQWRARNKISSTLQEASDPKVLSERLLQLIWHYQRLSPEPMFLLDGRKVRVLHPGFWNHEAGPDFREAIVQIGDAEHQIGDIEIDLVPGGWKQHGHDRNFNYKKVVLHVVWEAENVVLASNLPTLALKPYVDSPLTDLSLWLGKDPVTYPEGKCSAPLANLPSSLLEDLLHQAAQVRLQAKAYHFQARARYVGWEQSLWEGVFSALGYKQNVWPMRRVAEQIPALRSKEGSFTSAFRTQILLFGIGGLLPSQLTGTIAETDHYLRKAWDDWWRKRDQYTDIQLPSKMWHFHGIRPANHPQRRLALAAHWVSSGDLCKRLEEWFVASVEKSQLLASLTEVLEVREDEFWTRHWTLNSLSTKEPQPLIGPQRITDLAINIILPWFWLRSVVGKNDQMQRIAEDRYFAWPKSEDNAVLKLARQRLFRNSNGRLLNTAAKQQGLLQIVRDFCSHSNALCDRCTFPVLVGQIQGS